MSLKEGMVPIYTAEDIDKMVAELAHEIEKDYEGKEIVLICPLKGSVTFAADLCRKIKLPQIVDFIWVTSPKGESCHVVKDISVNLQGKHVIIVEEIIDAGRTLSFIKSRILASHPASLKVVSLLDKPSRRELPVKPDYVGATIEDRFVIGYGMDSEEIGRNYRDIFNFAQ